MWPDKAQYRPGETVTLTVPSGAASVVISELGRVVAALPIVDGQVSWAAPVGEAGPEAAAGPGTVAYTRHARGFRADAVDSDGVPFASTAFDVAPHWSLAPRYGFLSNFKPSDGVEAIEGLNRLHLNVVQYYDWMYTHYQYFAETEEFVDPLGRQTSHRVVRDRIEACHRHNIACLAYGSMYGGEKPIAEAHPEWLLYEADGRPLHLIDIFYLQNFDRGCGWREMILGEYEGAVKRLGFDGIHIDQYGFPKRAVYRPEPGVEQVVDLTRAMPGFVAEACRRLHAVKPDGGSIFNCVNNWPVEEIAPLRGDAATYIEVWHPHNTYRDLHELVRHARAAGPHKQVILSAYLKPFHPQAERTPGALNAFRLATGAIYGSGGFHLLLGEGDGVLTEAYYPTHGKMSPAEAAVAQQYYDFVTAFGELLHDLDLRDVSYSWEGETVIHSPIPCSPMAEPGKLWSLLKEKPGRRVLHLINLHGLEHSRWNESQAEPRPVEDVTVEFRVFTPVRAVWCASPDDGGAPKRLEFEPAGDGRPYVQARVPRVDFWTLVWVED